MTVSRHMANPILKPSDIKPSRPDFEVIGVFNAGVARYRGEVILMLRIAERPINLNSDTYLSPIYDVETDNIVVHSFAKGSEGFDFTDSRLIRTPSGDYPTSLSHLRIARSKDGIQFVVEERPTLFPANQYETYGIEDPRITEMAGTYYINYSAISPLGITTCLASTVDFVDFVWRGVIFHPDNKDVEIFPEQINGIYYALHRPSCSHFGKPEIWLAQSPDLICWGNHRFLMGVREESWDNGRIGGSAVPFRTPQGWIEIYHGATKDHRYCIGAVLLDAEQPWRILARSERPIMEPDAPYEAEGFFGGVIFPCGLLFEDNIIKLYYGAADTFIAYAEFSLEDVFASFER